MGHNNNNRSIGSTGRVTITDDDRLAPNAAIRLARKINKVPLPQQNLAPDFTTDYGKITHKRTEPKMPTRAFRLTFTARAELKAIGRTLGLTNETMTLEACIHAVAQRLDLISR